MSFAQLETIYKRIFVDRNQWVEVIAVLVVRCLCQLRLDTQVFRSKCFKLIFLLIVICSVTSIKSICVIEWYSFKSKSILIKSFWRLIYLSYNPTSNGVKFNGFNTVVLFLLLAFVSYIVQQSLPMCIAPFL